MGELDDILRAEAQKPVWNERDRERKVKSHAADELEFVQYPANRQGRRAAERAIKKAGLA